MNREGYARFYFPTMKIKNYNVVIDGKNIFDQQIKNNMKTYDNVQKITTSQEDDYTTGCLLDYNCFKKTYSIRGIDSS